MNKNYLEKKNEIKLCFNRKLNVSFDIIFHRFTLIHYSFHSKRFISNSKIAFTQFIRFLSSWFIVGENFNMIRSG